MGIVTCRQIDKRLVSVHRGAYTSSMSNVGAQLGRIIILVLPMASAG